MYLEGEVIGSGDLEPDGGVQRLAGQCEEKFPSIAEVARGWIEQSVGCQPQISENRDTTVVWAEEASLKLQ